MATTVSTLMLNVEANTGGAIKDLRSLSEELTDASSTIVRHSKAGEDAAVKMLKSLGNLTQANKALSTASMNAGNDLKRQADLISQVAGVEARMKREAERAADARIRAADAGRDYTTALRLIRAEMSKLDPASARFSDLAARAEHVMHRQAAAAGRLTAAFKSLATITGGILLRDGFHALINGLQAVVSRAYESAATLDRLGISLDTFIRREMKLAGVTMEMAGAEEYAARKAQELEKWMVELAANSPVKEQDVADSFRLAMAFGFTTKEAQRLVSALIDVNAATGLSSDKMEKTALALSQIRTKGKLAQQEVNQLAEAGIPVQEILGRAFNKTRQEIVEMQAAGELLATDVIPAIITALESDAAGAVERYNQSLVGTIERLNDITTIRLRDFFTGAFDAARPILNDLIDTLSSPEFTQSVKNLGKDFGELAAGALSFIVKDLLPTMVDGFRAIAPVAKAVWDGFKLAGSVVYDVAKFIGDNLTFAITLAATAATGFVGVAVQGLILTTTTAVAAAGGVGSLAAAFAGATLAAAPLLISLGFLAAAVYGLYKVTKMYEEVQASIERQAANINTKTGVDAARVALEQYNQADEATKLRLAATKARLEELDRQQSQIMDETKSKWGELGRGIQAMFTSTTWEGNDAAFAEGQKAKLEALRKERMALLAEMQAGLNVGEVGGVDTFFDSIIDKSQRSAEAIGQIRAKLDESVNAMRSSFEQLINADVQYFVSAEQRAFEHQRKMATLEAQFRAASGDEARAVIQERITTEREGYLRSEAEQALSYMRQEKEAMRHLGFMMIEYVGQMATAQGPNGPIAKNMAGLTQIISEQFGLNETAAGQMFGQFITGLNEFANSADGDLNRVSNAFTMSREQALGLQLQMDTLERERISQLVVQLENTGDFYAFYQAIHNVPSYVESLLYIDTTAAQMSIAALNNAVNILYQNMGYAAGAIGDQYAKAGMASTFRNMNVANPQRPAAPIQNYRPPVMKPSAYTPPSVGGGGGGGGGGGAGGGSGTQKSEVEKAQDAAKAGADAAKAIADAITATNEAFDAIKSFTRPDDAKVQAFADALSFLVSTVSTSIMSVSPLISDEKYGEFADNAKASVDLIASGVEGMMALHDFVAPARDKIFDFSMTLRDIIADFAARAQENKHDLNDTTKAWVEIANDIGGIFGAIEGIVALDGFKWSESLRQSLFDFSMILRDAIADAAARGKENENDLNQLTKDWIEVAGNTVSLIGEGVESFKDIEKFTHTPELREGLLAFFFAVRDAVADAAHRAKDFEPQALEAAKAFADTAGAVVAPIKDGVEGFNSLSEFAGVPRQKLELLMAGIDLAVRLMAQYAARMDTEHLEVAVKFAEAADAILAPIKSAVDAFKALTEEEYKGVPQRVMQLLMNDINVAVVMMQQMSRTFDVEGLASVAKFSEAVDGIMGGIKAGVDAFDELNEYGGLQRAKLYQFQIDFLEALSAIVYIAKQAQAFELEAQNWQDALVNAANLIRAGVDAIASLNGVNVDVTASAKISANAGAGSGAGSTAAAVPGGTSATTDTGVAPTTAGYGPRGGRGSAEEAEGAVYVTVNVDKVGSDMDLERAAYKIGSKFRKRRRR